MSAKPFLVLLDAGHGGIAEGVYTTPGKRYYKKEVSPNAKRFIFLAEGALNRAVVHGLAFRLHLSGIPCHIINPENEDISLLARVRRVNELARRYDCFLLSVHHNAAEDTTARGFELFTSRGTTKSDTIAEMIAHRFIDCYGAEWFRGASVLKKSKEAPFKILTNTRPPAILTEWGFMTNAEDRYRIARTEGIAKQVTFFEECIKVIAWKYFNHDPENQRA